MSSVGRAETLNANHEPSLNSEIKTSTARNLNGKFKTQRPLKPEPITKIWGLLQSFKPPSDNL